MKKYSMYLTIIAALFVSSSPAFGQDEEMTPDQKVVKVREMMKEYVKLDKDINELLVQLDEAKLGFKEDPLTVPQEEVDRLAKTTGSQMRRLTVLAKEMGELLEPVTKLLIDGKFAINDEVRALFEDFVSAEILPLEKDMLKEARERPFVMSVMLRTGSALLEAKAAMLEEAAKLVDPLDDAY